MVTNKNKARGSRKGSRTDTGDSGSLWRQPRPQVHRFVRSVGYNDIVKLPGDQGFGIQFTLADVPDYSEFQSLFDQYRIDMVEYMFINKSVPSGAHLPILYVCEDHDDASVPTASSLLEGQNTQILTFGSDRTQMKFEVKPNPLRQVFRSGVTPGYERAPAGTWLDCANADIPHYGLKYFINNYNNGTSTSQLGVAIRYHLSFRETI